MPHPNKKPWPIQEMIQWYSSGMSLQEVADRLASDEWQKYWIERIGTEYRPGQKIVNKILKRHTHLRGRGAPGSRNGSWKGGRRIDKGGYILIYQPDHPMAGENGCVREHRLVAEKALGRYLTPTEVVHHKDEDPANNDPSNLIVYETNGIHVSETRKGRQSRGQQVGISRAQRFRRGQYNPSDHWPDELLVQWHLDGLGLNQIASLLDCDSRTVACHLNRLGIRSRHTKPGVISPLHRAQASQFLASQKESKLGGRVSLRRGGRT